MKDIVDSLKRHISSIVFSYEVEVPEILLTPCRQIEHGDLTTNVAFLLASRLRQSPAKIAEALGEKIDHPSIVKIEVVSGYINFRIDPLEKLKQVISLHQQGASSLIQNHGQQVRCLMEYVSANPTGPLHVGHGRQAASADALVTIMRACGYDVDTEYYVNDAGLQMDVLVTSVWIRILLLQGLDSAMPLGLYQGDYLINVAKQIMKEYNFSLSNEQWEMWIGSLDVDVKEGMASGYKHKDVEIDAVKLMVRFAKQSLGGEYRTVLEKVLKLMVAGIKGELASLGVVMEHYFSEYSLVTSGSVDVVLERLASLGHTYEKDGAIWFASTSFGDDKDRVLVRSNGERTYFTNDIAYHWDKIERGYSRLINFLGSDHHGYVTRLKSAIAALGSDVSIDIRLVQFVSLVKKGERVAMSTRKATFETLSDVIDECGCDATRFFYTERHLDQPLDFDLELAVEKSQNNPVYYVQYAHARLCRLLEKSDGFDLEAAMAVFGEDESALWDMVLRLDDVMLRCVDQVDPSYLASYLIDISKKCHSYYNRVPVLNASDEERNMRLALLDAVRQVLAYSLNLLGVSSPESM